MCRLLEVALATGRTHQIRVHMTAIDHPIVGDKAYSSLNKAVESPRIFLHAHAGGSAITRPPAKELTFTSADAIRSGRGPRFRPLPGGRVGR